MKTTLTLFVTLLVIFTPVSTIGAHHDEHTKVVRLSDNTAMYVITYEFQAGSDPYFLPLLTKNAVPYGSKSNFVGYTAVQDGAMVTTGYKSSGLVLSSLPIENGKYRIEPLKRGTAMVVVFITKTGDSGSDVGLQLTNIPYYVDKELTLVDEADLEHYSTDAILLGSAEPDCNCDR